MLANARPEPSLRYNPVVFRHPVGEGDGGGQGQERPAQISRRAVWAFCVATRGVPAAKQREPRHPPTRSYAMQWADLVGPASWLIFCALRCLQGRKSTALMLHCPLVRPCSRGCGVPRSF
jgi:hypothetical protein